MNTATKITLTLLSVVHSLGASAQEGSQTRRGLSIEEVLVTAQKREEGANDIPLAISTYTGEDLFALGVSDTRDLGKLLPGFTYADGGFNTPIYTLRGVGFNENSQTASATVGVYIDEFNLPFPIMTKGSNLDLARVEVLKGPQGTLYGRNTTGGAINYIANKPSDSLTYGGSLGYSSYQTSEANGFISGPLTENVSARLALRTINSREGWQRSRTRHPSSEAYNGNTGRNLGGEYQQFGYDTLGEVDKQSGRFSLSWQLADNIDVSYHLDGWRDRSEPQALQVIAIESQNAILGAAGLHPEVADYPVNDKNTQDNRAADWPNNGMEFRLNDSFYSSGVRVGWAVSDNVDAVFLASLGRFESDGSFIPQSGVDTVNTERNVFATTDYYNLEWRLSGNYDDDVFWQFGVNYSEDDVAEFQRLHHETVSIIFPVDAPNGDGVAGLDNRSGFGGNQLAKVAAVFVHSEWEFTDNLTLSGGARYTDESRKFNGCGQDVNVADEPGADQDSAGAQDEGVGLATAFSALSLLQSPLAGYLPGTAAQGGCFTLDNETRRPGRYFGELQEDNVSGRLALDWRFAEDMLGYIALSRGFKSGSFPVINISDSVQFEPVTQEQLDAVEIGGKFTLLNKAMQLNASVFDYRYKDKQLVTNFRDPIFGALPILRNAPKSTVRGAELDIKYTPVEGLYLSVAAAYLDTEVEELVSGDSNGDEFDFAGKPFNYSPRWEYTLLLDYVLPVFERYELSVGIDYSYSGETNASLEQDERFFIDDYGVINARLAFAPSVGPWELMLWSRNLGDEYYYNNVTNQLDTIGRYTGMPVTYGISLSWQP
ncbi:TonB-dependent receptor [Zhongshania sp. BJYM1]|uniref:TonB-dependent receptor n=1 Tax=Zhongshania aquatica TaxID=2965069 RepID=UPI0022B56301|nr:TonB-dependent receptor [Marortus sp. BJYM1]